MMTARAKEPRFLAPWLKWARTHIADRPTPGQVFRAITERASKRPATSVLYIVILLSVIVSIPHSHKHERRSVLRDFWSIPEATVEAWKDTPSLCPGLRNVVIAIKYDVSDGAIDQYMAHISAFSLARELGAQVIMPKAKYANATAVKLHNQVQWLEMPASKLLHLDKIRTIWRKYNIRIFTSVPRALRSRAHPGLNAPDPSITVAYVHGVNGGLADAVRSSCAAVEQAVRHPDYPARPAGLPRRVVLDLGEALMLLRVSTRTESRRAVDTMRRLPFASRLTALATLGASRAIQLGVSSYNGLHLDASGGAASRDAGRVHDVTASGGRVGWGQARSDRLGEYRAYLEAAGFSRAEPVYVASELLEPLDASWGAGAHAADPSLSAQSLASAARASATFREVCAEFLYQSSKRVLHRGVLLTEAEMGGLELEQLAVVDLLMLVASRRFLGHSRSVFSVFTGEIRTLSGVSPDDTWLIATRGDSTIVTETVMMSGGNRVGLHGRGRRMEAGEGDRLL